MLPDPLASALPAIVRHAAFPVTRCPPDPRLDADHPWPVGERPHVTALAPERGAVDHLTVGVHRLRAPGGHAHLDYAKAKRGGR